MLVPDMGVVENLTGVTLTGHFKGASERTHVQLIRYGLVAGAAFAIDFGTLVVLASGFHVNYLLAAAIAFCLGLVTNYLLSTVWVFNAYSVSSKHWEFMVFAVTGLVGLAMTELLIWFFTSEMHLFYLVSKLGATAMVVFWNFFSRKFLLYR